MSTIPRYYVEWVAEPATLFALTAVDHRATGAWQVFDRCNCGPCGEAQAVTMCVNRTYACRIRDALNACDQPVKVKHTVDTAIQYSVTVRGNCGVVHDSLDEWRACKACDPK